MYLVLSSILHHSLTKDVPVPCSAIAFTNSSANGVSNTIFVAVGRRLGVASNSARNRGTISSNSS